MRAEMDPAFADRDATAADAARVANEAGTSILTLIHLNPDLDDLGVLLDDAAGFDRVRLGRDELVLS